MDRIEKDDDAVQAARSAAVGALRSAGLVAHSEHGATGLSVIETAARPRGAAIIITLGGPDPLEVCAALDDAGVGCDYAAEEPWRIYVLAPGDAHPTMEPAEVVDEHEHPVEDDGGDEEFEEVGTAAPMAVGLSLDRPVAALVERALDQYASKASRIARDLASLRSREQAAGDAVEGSGDGPVTASDVTTAANEATLLRMAADAITAAIKAFDERVAAVVESEV